MNEYNNIKIHTATTFFKKFIGLMFKKNISYGIYFKNCRSIHTFFMFDKIDVIAYDKDNNIIKIYKNVKPCKIIITPKNTKNILELPKNTIK